MQERLRWVGQAGVWLLLAICFLLLCLHTWDATHTVNIILHTSTRAQNVMIQLLSWAAFVASTLLLSRLPRRVMPVVIVLGALVLGIIALGAQPNTSTDAARYNWDGIVQLAGVSPYRYVPVDDHLAALRPEWLFPLGSSDGNGHILCPAYASPTTVVTLDGSTGHYLCTMINRPQVPTIYPPVAELIFAGVRLFVPATVTYLPMQVFGLICVLALTVLLLLLLRRLRISPAWVAAWAWCPLVIQQAITNAHIDIAGVLLAVLATAAVLRGRHTLGGVLFGAAIMVKFLPGLLLIPFMRRSTWRVPVAAVISVALGYGVHLLTGVNVLGYLNGYLAEEGYDDGSRSALLGLLLPATYVTLAAGAMFLLLALWVWRNLVTQPWLAQLVLFGGALFLASPKYPWYALLLVPLIVLTQRWEWFALVCALVYRQFDARLDMFQNNLLLALFVILLVTVGRDMWASIWNKQADMIVVTGTPFRT